VVLQQKMEYARKVGGSAVFKPIDDYGSQNLPPPHLGSSNKLSHATATATASIAIPTAASALGAGGTSSDVGAVGKSNNVGGCGGSSSVSVASTSSVLRIVTPLARKSNSEQEALELSRLIVAGAELARCDAAKTHIYTHNARSFTWADGTKYVGQVDANRPHGHGVLTLPSQDVYEGQFVNGLKQVS